jgi:hypothetical protein
MKAILYLICVFCACNIACAQDPEFPKKEFIMHLRLHNGMVTNFKSTPDLYVGGLQIIPQWTVVENHLRLGIVAGGFYSGKKLQGLIGPTVSLKLKSLSNSLGSLGNINLSLDHWWGTKKQHLFGGSFNFDLLNKMVAGISLHRDYHLNNWWLQGSVAFRISKVKQPPHP